MQKKTVYIILAIVLLALPVWGQNKYIFRTRLPHPRLLWFKGEEKSIRDKLAKNDFLLRAHNYIIGQCEIFIGEPCLEHVLIGKRMLKVSRKALQRIYFLSYAWRMTGDDRFAARAKKEMINVCRFKDWNPAHFLDVAEMTLALSIGYDWLYDFLDENTRQTIRKSIVTKGLNESIPETAGNKSYYAWLDKVNNWNQVCNTGMIFGAIVTSEFNPGLSEKIITRGITSVRDKSMQEYQPDGNYPEGYTYWSYGTCFNVMLIDALEKCYGSSFGMSEIQGFNSTPEFILQMTTRDLGCFAYSDCNLAEIGMSYPLFWFASRQQKPDLLWGELQKYRYMCSEGLEERAFNVRYLPSLMLWASEDAMKNPAAPVKTLYTGRGPTPVAILRNHWGGEDEIFLGLKGGKCTTNHAHMDVGSFVMYTGKNQWVKDIGLQEYNSLEKYGLELGDRSQYSSRWQALRFGNVLHNVIIFSDSLQRVDGKAMIDRYNNNKNFKFAISDLTAVNRELVQKHARGIAIIEGKYTVVRDEIVNDNKSDSIRWAVLTPASVSIVNDNMAELTLNGQKLLLIAEGKGIRLQTWTSGPRHFYDEPNPGTVLLGFKNLVNPGECVSYTVFLVPFREKDNYKTELPPLAEWK